MTITFVVDLIRLSILTLLAGVSAFAENRVAMPIRDINLAGVDVEVSKSMYADVSDAELEQSAEDPNIRFMLALPNQTVPVQLRVLIDGQPFRKPRETRIKRLLSGDKDDALSSRYHRYEEVTSRKVTFDEARWLFRRWGADGSLMKLSEDFERSRASQSPVLDCLDRDGDGTLDSSEIASAIESLKQCDTNADDVISSEELKKAANGLVRRKVVWAPARLATPFADTATTLEPLITIAVDFTTTGGECAVSSSAAVNVRGESAYFDLGGATVQVTALRTLDSKNTDQVSLGVVNDGFPIAPLLDTNQDGRLTIRELRTVPQSLIELDQNDDGQITSEELLPTIRIAIGHGLCVHQFLSTVRAGHMKLLEAIESPPDWFKSLDTNNDNDLSRREFVGTQEQFNKLDTDSDGLVSIAEANETP